MADIGTLKIKTGFAEMFKGGVIMDVVTAEQAKVAEDAGAVAVMALERVPSDIRKAGEDALTLAREKEVSAADSLLEAADRIKQQQPPEPPGTGGFAQAHAVDWRGVSGPVSSAVAAECKQQERRGHEVDRAQPEEHLTPACLHQHNR